MSGSREGYIRIRRHRPGKEKAAFAPGEPGTALQSGRGKRARTAGPAKATLPLPAGVVVSPGALLAPAHCAAVVLACELAATTGGGAGTTDAWRASQKDSELCGYTQATADLELDAHPGVRRALLERRFAFSAKIDAHMAAHYGRHIIAMDDCFIVK